MSVDIPPSPRAEDVPEYARRLREVRELSRKRSVHRRWRDRPKGNEKAQAASKGDRGKPSEGGMTSVRWVRSSEQLRQNDEQGSRCSGSGFEDVPRRAERETPRRSGKHATRCGAEPRAGQKVRRKGKAHAVDAPKDDLCVIEKAVAASVAASCIVSFFVVAVTQGLGDGRLVGPGALLGAMLSMIGVGS